MFQVFEEGIWSSFDTHPNILIRGLHFVSYGWQQMFKTHKQKKPWCLVRVVLFSSPVQNSQESVEWIGGSPRATTPWNLPLRKGDHVRISRRVSCRRNLNALLSAFTGRDPCRHLPQTRHGSVFTTLLAGASQKSKYTEARKWCVVRGGRCPFIVQHRAGNS